MDSCCPMVKVGYLSLIMHRQQLLHRIMTKLYRNDPYMVFLNNSSNGTNLSHITIGLKSVLNEND